MENSNYKIKEPEGEPNGKTLTLIGEFCKNWVLFRRKNDFENLLIIPLSKKGYKVKYNVIPFPFRIPVEYSISKIENGEKIKIFSNREEEKKNDVIIGFELNKDNAEEIIKKIIK